MAIQLLRFTGDDSRIHTQVGEKTEGVIRLRARAGFGLFGPYVDLPAGPCVARIHFAEGARGRVTADLLAGGRTVLALREVDLDALGGQPLELSAVLDRWQSACEVRVLCDAGVQADIRAVELEVATSLDKIDSMDFIQGAFEDPEKYEGTMGRIYQDAEQDEILRFTLRHACLEKDVQSSFDFYDRTSVPDAIVDLLGRFGIDRSAHLVDVGCGRGHATHALYKRGFERITAMDPNGEYATGTGYLASLGTGIDIINDLQAWRATYARFDAAVSSSTVHHWQHIPHYALDLRRTLKTGGYWFMLTEYFANNGPEFAALLGSHQFAKRYGTYEWPYPASAYADLIESVGFRLAAVVPLHYRDNAFYTADQPKPDGAAFDVASFSAAVDALLDEPGGTVREFWKEVSALRYVDVGFHDALHHLFGRRFYTNPQVMVFRRTEVE